jgi:hypothetical protein
VPPPKAAKKPQTTMPTTSKVLNVAHRAAPGGQRGTSRHLAATLY